MGRGYNSAVFSWNMIVIMLLTCIKKLLISFYGLIQLLFHFHVIFSNFPRIKKKVKKLVCFSSFDIFCSVQASYKEKICIKMVILYISLVLKKKKNLFFFALPFKHSFVFHFIMLLMTAFWRNISKRLSCLWQESVILEWSIQK